MRLFIMPAFKRIGATARACASSLKACCITVHYAPLQPGRGWTSDDEWLKGTDMLIL
jgi:hypothetical protein